MMIPNKQAQSRKETGAERGGRSTDNLVCKGLLCARLTMHKQAFN